MASKTEEISQAVTAYVKLLMEGREVYNILCQGHHVIPEWDFQEFFDFILPLAQTMIGDSAKSFLETSVQTLVTELPKADKQSFIQGSGDYEDGYECFYFVYEQAVAAKVWSKINKDGDICNFICNFFMPPSRVLFDLLEKWAKEEGIIQGNQSFAKHIQDVTEQRMNEVYGECER